MQSQEPNPPKVITAINGSLMVGLLLFDVILEGCYVLSLTICPCWFLISLIKNGIMRPGWRIAILRMSMPILTLGIAMSIGCLQWKISDANADRIIKACEEFRVANGRYPTELGELVPKYLTSIPPAKYCGMGKFFYCNMDGRDHCLLWWSRYGFYRRFYALDEKRWSNLD